MKYRHLLIAALALASIPVSASAHAFGMIETLPLPISFYITGGIAAFIASCAVLLAFSRPYVARLKELELRTPMYSRVVRALPILSYAIAAAAVIVGFFGDSDWTHNPLPDFFWVIFLLFFAYLHVLFGGLWRILDPFRALSQLINGKRSDVTAPAWMAYIPAVFLLGLLWLELLSHGLSTNTKFLSLLLLAYGVFSVVMSHRYGVRTWFENGDFFTRFFDVFSRVAPVQLERDRIAISLPGTRLIQERTRHTAELFFILGLLGATVFDGLRETTTWWDLVFGLGLTNAGVYYVTQIVMLIAAPLLLFVLYSLSLWVSKQTTSTLESLPDMRLRYAYSLVPIAIAYHFAHYFSLILSNGQQFYARISDPLHKGWDLFGTASYHMNKTLISSDTVWYWQLGAIVLGHILAAYITHRIARESYSSTRDVIVSQIPMIILMVFFTAFGLWTLAQPFLAA